MIRKSFKRELLISFVGVALVPLIISGILLVWVFHALLLREYRINTDRQLSQMESSLTDVYRSTEDAMKQLAGNDVVLAFLNTSDRWEQNKVYNELYEETGSLRSYASFDIYDASGICRYSTGDTAQGSVLPTYWGILKSAATHPEDTIVSKASEYSAGSGLLQLCRAITDGEDIAGFLLADLSEDHLERILVGASDSTSYIALLDNHLEEIFASASARSAALPKTLRMRALEGQPLQKSGDEILLQIREVEGMNLYLAAGTRDVFTDDFTATLLEVLLVMALLSLFICIFMASFGSRYLSGPIARLTEAMGRVREGDLETRVSVDREDELGQLSDSFNTMTGELKDYMELQVAQQKELNDTTLEMMQAQLNPHFLYNTLDTMKWVAKSSQAPVLANMASDLASILRTSISGNRLIRLKEELDLVQAYVDIQKVRFQGDFDFDMEVPMELEDCLVPKLLIQPIVENSVIHGLEGRKDGYVFLNIYEEEGRLVINVTDDGRGMSEEQMELVNRGESLATEKNGRRRHIGIRNIATILRLNYGDSADIHVRAGQDGGTEVTLRLPIAREQGV